VRVVFPTGEYAHPRTGTMETLQTIQRDDIVKLYRTWYRPDNAVLIFVGDLTLEQGKTYAQKYFGTWKAAGPMPRAPNSADDKIWNPKRVVIDMPEAGQAAVLLAKPAIKRVSPDYYTGLVANAALGTGSASRLNHEIRVKRGLSYGAGSVLDARRDAGQFIASAQTKNESAAEVAGLLQSELKRLITEPVQGDELKARQALLIGEYARGLETNLGFCGAIASLATHNLPLDTLNRFIPSINAVTTKDIAGFAGKYFKKPPGLIIAGKAPAFIAVLKKNVPEVKVIRQDELDLNHPDLVRPKSEQKTPD
jgi:zinc protease